MPEFVTPRPGITILQKYVVERVLGQGGMGVVVSARHDQLDQRVAIKILSTPNADEREHRRILREARAAVRISSDHVARVLDFGIDESGRPCIVMEYLEGENLAEVLETHGPQRIQTAVGYVLHACEALAAAHEAGIVHRDLKPENLFLTRRPDGSPLVKVLDFGISKTLDPNPREAGSTTGNLVIGSVPYMSPEQLSTPLLVDDRADVWGLGVVLYELLAGRPAFTADPIGVLVTSIMVDVPPALREQRAEVPAELEAVVMRCLAKSPADRLQSVRALAMALEPWAPSWAQQQVAITARLRRYPTVSRVLSSTQRTILRLPRPARLALAVFLPVAIAAGAALFDAARRVPANDEESAAVPAAVRPAPPSVPTPAAIKLPVPATVEPVRADAGVAPARAAEAAAEPLVARPARPPTVRKTARPRRRHVPEQTMTTAASERRPAPPPEAPVSTDPLSGRK